MGLYIAGTYSYPISFLLPPHLPPTFSVPYGSLNYAIKGVAHRPGTFTSKLSCQVPLLVVAAPAIGTGEGGGAGDPGPLFIQKQWQDKLAYSFGLSSPLFLLGSERHLEASENVRAYTESLVEAGVQARAEAAYGTATLDLTLLPLEKIKIWGFGVFVDERIRYLDEREKPLRDDDKRQVKVLEVQDTRPTEEMDPGEEEQTQKNKQKHKHDPARIPLLPTPISPHRSPLLPYLPQSTDPSVIAGPGPYALSTNIGLPGCSDPSGSDCRLHFTMKQKGSNVRVEHSLRLIIKVEWVGGGEEAEGKRLFDITVQTPITILSVSSAFSLWVCVRDLKPNVLSPRNSVVAFQSARHSLGIPRSQKRACMIAPRVRASRVSWDPPNVDVDMKSETASGTSRRPARCRLSRAKPGLQTTNAAATDTRDHRRTHGEAVLRAHFQQRCIPMPIHRRPPAGDVRRAGTGPRRMPKRFPPVGITTRAPSRSPRRRPASALSRRLPRRGRPRWHDTSGSCQDWRAKLGRPRPRTRVLRRGLEAVRDTRFV